MAQDSNIEWTDHTFNPWIGCTKVSPGCAHCYAETLMDTRLKAVNWGPGNPRQRTSAANWKKPLQWNAKAAKDGTRPRVFCASLADVFDPEVPPEWLIDLLKLIRDTPDLDWLLLTKRPQLWQVRLRETLPHGLNQHTHRPVTVRKNGKATYEGFVFNWLDGFPPPNVWLGTTVEDQARASERIPALLRIPAKIRFLSCEPLLEAVDLHAAHPARLPLPTNHQIDWVICGGESGPNARPMHPDWARTLRDQCAQTDTPFLFKQWGEWLPTDQGHVPLKWPGKPVELQLLEGTKMFRIGKKAAGRELDGQIHHNFPTN